MPIVSEKQFLTTEELQNIKDIQSKTQSLILELGEIEMIKIQLENRYELAKSFLKDLSDLSTKKIVISPGMSVITPPLVAHKFEFIEKYSELILTFKGKQYYITIDSFDVKTIIDNTNSNINENVLQQFKQISTGVSKNTNFLSKLERYYFNNLY